MNDRKNKQCLRIEGKKKGESKETCAIDRNVQAADGMATKEAKKETVDAVGIEPTTFHKAQFEYSEEGSAKRKSYP